MVKYVSRCSVCLLVLLSLLAVVMQLTACSEGSGLSIAGSGGDLSVVGSPTVSRDFVNQVLADHSSPAAGMGDSFYYWGTQSNIDPVFALGFFKHESDFGKKGVAVQSHSIGNLRCLPKVVCVGGFAYFADWPDGIRAWFRLLQGPLYVEGGLTTLGQIIPRYAPSSDGNNEQAYIQAVAQDVGSWRFGQDPH